MTDTEQKRIKEICKVAHIDDINDLSDGYHTFKQLYYQRMILFAALVKQNRDKAWKSLRHEDGELCFGGGWFIVGIDTPEGSYTYHYEDNYFSLFDCEELERGKPWDGHTEKDVIRLLSLEQDPIIDKIKAEIGKIYEREGNSSDCLNALDDLKYFIDKCKVEEKKENDAVDHGGKTQKVTVTTPTFTIPVEKRILITPDGDEVTVRRIQEEVQDGGYN